jgi:hypothetical protein
MSRILGTICVQIIYFVNWEYPVQHRFHCWARCSTLYAGYGVFLYDLFLRTNRSSPYLGNKQERCRTCEKVWQSYRVSENFYRNVTQHFHSDNNYPCFRIFEGTAPIILLADPDLLRNVLIKDSQLFINRRVRHKNFFLLLLYLNMFVNTDN